MLLKIVEHFEKCRPTIYLFMYSTLWMELCRKLHKGTKLNRVFNVLFGLISFSVHFHVSGARKINNEMFSSLFTSPSIFLSLPNKQQTYFPVILPAAYFLPFKMPRNKQREREGIYTIVLAWLFTRFL